MQGPAPSHPAQPIFLYDLGSPECYLMAEQVMHSLPVIPEWQPVLAEGFEAPGVIDRQKLERAAAQMGIQEIRWPRRVPADSRLAMLAATYAKEIGRGVSFSLAAFRQAFAGGHDLGLKDTVLIAGAACEMHPTALLKALERASVARTLDQATTRALQAGVRALPAVLVAGRVFSGERTLPRAAAALLSQAGTGQAHRA